MTAHLENIVTPRLGVVTCQSDDSNTLAPTGHHLRWFLPKKLGFPAGGFDLWRIDSGKWEHVREQLAQRADLRRQTTDAQSQLNWSARERHYPVHTDAILVCRADVKLEGTRSGLQVVKQGSGKHLLLHFKKPVIHVSLKFGESSSVRQPRGPIFGNRNTALISNLLNGRPIIRGPVAREPVTRRPTIIRPLIRSLVSEDVNESGKLIVHHHAALIGSWPMADSVEIEHPGITHILIPNTIDALTGLSFVTEQDVVEYVDRNPNEYKLKHLNLPQSPTHAYDLIDFTNGINNRLFSGNDVGAFKNRYPYSAVKKLIYEMKHTVGAPNYTIEGKNSPLLKAIPVRVLDQLQFATLDPNIARLLALYWVDNTPKRGLYIIRADYADPEKTFANGFAFSSQSASLPRIVQPKAKQLPGIEYVDRNPMGRAGLYWSSPKPTHKDSSRAIMVDVARVTSDDVTALTEKQPRLISKNVEVQFTDRHIAVPSKLAYQITPIDIFGRSGPTVTSDTINIVDLAYPPPPKQVKAVLTQHGAPWTNPSARDENKDFTGAVNATAEFGESLSIVAPDAREIHWYWRSGSVANRTPHAWHSLAITELEPVASLKLSWPANSRLTHYPVEIADVRSVDLAPNHSASEQPSGALRAILLNVALFEPGLFDGHYFRVNGIDIPIIGSTAGIAAEHDTSPEQRMTARLFVVDSAMLQSLQKGDVISIQYPTLTPGQSETGKTPLIHVPLPVESTPSHRAAGGEVAIDFHHVIDTDSLGEHHVRPVNHDASYADARNTTITGRVAADYLISGKRVVLIRVRTQDAQRLLTIEEQSNAIETHARHHRPYIMPEAKLGLEGKPGDIELNLAPDQRFETLWLSASIVDQGDKQSRQLARPTELRVLRPPPHVQPAAPFPEREGFDAHQGQLSPPDRNGDATVAVAWSPIAVGTMTDHVRYELGRALDRSIISANYDRWLRGAQISADIEAFGIKPGKRFELTLHTAYTINGNGTVSATALANSNNALQHASDTGRARLRTKHLINGSIKDLYHRLVKISIKDNNEIELLFRPFVKAEQNALGVIVNNSICEIEGAPDYTSVLASDEKLRQFADLSNADDALYGSNEQAFGLVTGVPIDTQRFTDRLPGQGRSRYFYKVRAIFPGETRSAWSPCSVAFHQLDATPAAVPEEIKTVRYGNSLLATFLLPNEPKTQGIRLTTRDAEGNLVSENDYFIDTADESKQLKHARLCANKQLVDMRLAVGSIPLASTDTPGITGLFKADIDRNNTQDQNLLETSEHSRGIVVLPSTSNFDGLPLAVQLRNDDDDIVWIDRVAHRFEIEINNYLADYSYTLSTLKYITLRGSTLSYHSEEIELSRGRK